MTTKLTSAHYVRHVQSTGNLQRGVIQGRSNHLEITPKGRLQAALTGVWLKNTFGTPDAVRVSPAARTVRTAEIALEAAGLQCDLIIDERLQEVSQGEWEGKSRELMKQPDVQERMAKEGMAYRSPGGETLGETQTRMVEAHQQLPDGSIWVFTHGLALRCLVGHYEGWRHGEILSQAGRMYNGSVTDIETVDTETEVVNFAQFAHIPPLYRTS